MSTLTKWELGLQLSKERRFDGITQELAVDIIETIFDLIVCNIQSGKNKVSVRGFGCFKLRTRKAFTGYNVQTGEPVEIAEKLSISYKPAAEVNRRLNLK